MLRPLKTVVSCLPVNVQNPHRVNLRIVLENIWSLPLTADFTSLGPVVYATSKVRSVTGYQIQPPKLRRSRQDSCCRCCCGVRRNTSTRKNLRPQIRNRKTLRNCLMTCTFKRVCVCFSFSSPQCPSSGKCRTLPGNYFRLPEGCPSQTMITRENFMLDNTAARLQRRRTQLYDPTVAPELDFPI
jgi:hypothetical protein